MRDWLDNSRDRRESVTPAIRVAIALSVLIHVAALWRLPQVQLSLPETPERSDTSPPLSVRLAPPTPPPSRPPSAAAQRARPPATVRAAPKAAPRPRSPPRVIAREQPAEAPPAKTPPVVAPPPERRAAGDDLSSYIEAKRRAREEAARPPPAPASTVSKTPPPEDENARIERIVAANLSPQHTMRFGHDPTRRGGLFHIEHMSDDAAEFMFYGWHKVMRRNMAQLIEVRKGGNPDIRIAVIRRMIAIIRDYEQADFVWESRRLGRNVTLSARARDNAGLEDFLMAEFFGDPHPSQ